MSISENESATSGAGGEFDPGAPPPFKIADVRSAIPAHCWVKNPWWSLSYVVKDIAVCLGLLSTAVYLDHWFFWPVYWLAQGTMFWALFALGHDCGHGSLSDMPLLNDVVGHLLHSAILLPYHWWQLTHRKHHQNHGNVEKDETWVPFSEKLYKELSDSVKFIRFKIPFIMFAYPVYVLNGNPGKSRSYIKRYTDLFKTSERSLVITSTVCWLTMVGFLFYMSTIVGPWLMLKIYGIPHMIFVAWITIVTYLHHHGHEQKLPWYRGKDWSYLRGGLTTVDRDYGVFNKIHHDIGTHVIHHLFPQIPHYHLKEATREAKKVLGKYYREPKKSGFFPFHLIPLFVNSFRSDHYVSDTGGVVYYQTDEKLFSSKADNKME